MDYSDQLAEELDIYEIDIASIELAGVKPSRIGYEDVAEPANNENCGCDGFALDGVDDLTLKFKTQNIVEAMGDVKEGDEVILALTGTMLDGTPIGGADCVTIIKKGKKGKRSKKKLRK